MNMNSCQTSATRVGLSSTGKKTAIKRLRRENDHSLDDGYGLTWVSAEVGGMREHGGLEVEALAGHATMDLADQMGGQEWE